jgi:hypothetical protein
MTKVSLLYRCYKCLTVGGVSFAGFLGVLTGCLLFLTLSGCGGGDDDIVCRQGEVWARSGGLTGEILSPSGDWYTAVTDRKSDPWRCIRAGTYTTTGSNVTYHAIAGGTYTYEYSISGKTMTIRYEEYTKTKVEYGAGCPVQ